jgi:hypothetical protein
MAINRMTGTESSTLQLGNANVFVSRPRLHRIGRRFHEHEPPTNAARALTPPFRYGLAYADA